MYPVIQFLGFGPGRWASSRERRMKSRTNLHSTLRLIRIAWPRFQMPNDESHLKRDSESVIEVLMYDELLICSAVSMRTWCTFLMPEDLSVSGCNAHLKMMNAAIPRQAQHRVLRVELARLWLDTAFAR